MIRNSLSFVSWKDRKTIMPSIKAIYHAENADAALPRLEEFEAEWGKRYPAIAAAWRRACSTSSRSSPSCRRSVFPENDKVHNCRRPFVQDNMSRSGYGVLRGLHLQNPSTQGKLVSVLRGRVLDVAVDVRIGSPNFGRHVAVELSEENRRQLWVPRGFAHGFAVLSQAADFFYKCDELYSPKDEIVVRWDDPAIGINWTITDPSLSERDAVAPRLADVKNLPFYGQT